MLIFSGLFFRGIPQEIDTDEFDWSYSVCAEDLEWSDKEAGEILNLQVFFSISVAIYFLSNQRALISRTKF